MEAETEAGSG